MSKPMNKTTKRVLIGLAVIVLLAACFVSVSLYAKHEMSKPTFELPDTTLSSASELPEVKEEVVRYVLELYETAISADDVEASWHTDAKLKDYDEDISTPFSDADNEIILYIREHAGDAIKELYPQADKLTLSKNEGVFIPDITSADVLDFSAERGRYNDDNVYVDDDYYFITLKISPDVINADEIPESEIYGKFVERFASAFTVENAEFEVKSVTMSFKVFRPLDQLSSLEVTRSYRVKADIELTDTFRALSSDGKAQVELPYESTEKISFKHYGAYFAQSCVVHNKGDMNALPAKVTVKEEATADDYELSFSVSEDGYVEIDSDGVMTVNDISENPLTVTMTLKFNGHTYTDDLLVYLTQLEVATDAQ